jgi:hypothetical protein
MLVEGYRGARLVDSPKSACTMLHSTSFRYHRGKEAEEGATRWINQPRRRP